MAWSRISSKVIANPPSTHETCRRWCGDYRYRQTHVYRKRPIKESRKCWECKVEDAEAGLATAYRGTYNVTLVRLSGRRLKACWTRIMGSNREPEAESAIGQSSCQRK